MKKLAAHLLLGGLLFVVSCDGDEKPVNHAIRFDGIDDYIELGNIYDDAKLPITISSWVWLDPGKSDQAPIFVSQGDNNLYKGFWFVINPTTLFAGYGDGLGDNNTAYRRDKSAVHNSVGGKWLHVAAVIKGATDMNIYLNGENIGGESSGTSTSPMKSNFPNALAKIGYWYSNGVTYRFEGMIDELKIWSRALEAEEIKKQMQEGVGESKTNLVGYWNFEEEDGVKVFDKSTLNYHGELKGNPARVESIDVPFPKTTGQ